MASEQEPFEMLCKGVLTQLVIMLTMNYALDHGFFTQHVQSNRNRPLKLHSFGIHILLKTWTTDMLHDSASAG